MLVNSKLMNCPFVADVHTRTQQFWRSKTVQFLTAHPVYKDVTHELKSAA